MSKINAFLVCIFASFLFIFGGFTYSPTINAKAENGEYVYIGGIPAGFMISAGGAQVIGICEVVGETETVSPAGKAGIKTGDLITKAGEITIENISDLNSILEKNQDKNIELTVKRGETIEKITVKPRLDKISKKYKIGVLIRDTVSGIGTITYIDVSNRKFGSLGHTVGADNTISKDSKLYQCSIVGSVKGIRGKAGELHGMFLSENALGEMQKTCNCGIFGKIYDSVDLSSFQKAQATSNGAKPGKGYILSTISGLNPVKYEIEVVKVDKDNKENKNFVLKIVDEALINATGGIVQGMSGSPIIQDEKLIGAVTHVFLNDPTRGYGIAIEKMLDCN